MTLRTDFTDATASSGTHPIAHNETNAAVNALTTVQPWQTPTLLAPYTNYDVTNNNAAGYFKDPFGVVHLRGILAPNGAAFNGAAFTLPVGYRSAKIELMLGYGHNGTIETAYQVRIEPNGNVLGWNVGSWMLISLDGVTFRAAP
jgi:hypothetical protein